MRLAHGRGRRVGKCHGSDKVQVTTSGGEQVQGLQVKVQGEVEGYDVIVAHAYVDPIGFHLVVYCELVQTGRLFQIVAPLACIILMVLAASSLSSGTPELLGPKILTNTLALLALSFFGSHPDLTFATSPSPSTSVPPPPWLVALNLGAQCLVVAVAVAACVAYRAYMSDTAILAIVMRGSSSLARFWLHLSRPALPRPSTMVQHDFDDERADACTR